MKIKMSLAVVIVFSVLTASSRARADVALILDNYPSLYEVRDRLIDESLVDENGNEITAYQLVCALINDGYDGFRDNSTTSDFFSDRLDGLTREHHNILKEYVIRVVHALWLEENDIVPWSLRDYSREEIRMLFLVIDPATPTEFDTSIGWETARSHATFWGPEGDDPRYPTHPVSKDAAFKLFLLSYKLGLNDCCEMPADRYPVMRRILRWLKKNFFHAYEEWDWDVAYESGNHDPVTIEALFRERITGCWHCSFLLTDMMRSLNIPALGIAPDDHGNVYLPTIDRYVHGDHIADTVAIPADDYFLTADQMREVLAIGYSDFLSNRYARRMHFIHLNLLRSENRELYLRLFRQFGALIPEEDLAIINNEVREYNLRTEEGAGRYFSDYLPIRGLDDDVWIDSVSPQETCYCPDTPPEGEPEITITVRGQGFSPDDEITFIPQPRGGAEGSRRDYIEEIEKRFIDPQTFEVDVRILIPYEAWKYVCIINRGVRIAAFLAECFELRHCCANRPPEFDPIDDQRVREGALLTFIVPATDADDDVLSYRAIGLPEGAEFSGFSRRFRWTPTYEQGRMKPYTATFFVTDVEGAEDSVDVRITVVNRNRAPVFEPVGDQRVREGELLTFSVRATDADGDELNYGADWLPRGAVFDRGSRRFSWTPSYDQARREPYTVRFWANDGQRAEGYLIMRISVINDVDVLDLPVFKPLWPPKWWNPWPQPF